MTDTRLEVLAKLAAEKLPLTLAGICDRLPESAPVEVTQAVIFLDTSGDIWGQDGPATDERHYFITAAGRSLLAASKPPDPPLDYARPERRAVPDDDPAPGGPWATLHVALAVLLVVVVVGYVTLWAVDAHQQAALDATLRGAVAGPMGADGVRGQD